MNRFRRWCVLGLGALAALTTISTARVETLELRRLEVRIDGPPVTVLPADLNRDGRLDLFVVTAFTYWGQSSGHETQVIDGQLVEIVEVLPSLVDRREMHLFLALPDGSYAPAGPARPLPVSVLAFDLGPSSQPVLALTDGGVSAVLFTAADAEPLSLQPIIEDVPVLAHTGSLLPGYRFSFDLDGDGERDVLLPAQDGLAVHLAVNGVLTPEASQRLELPGDETGKDGVVWRRYPLPMVQDVTADGRPDLVVYHSAAETPLVRFENRPSLNAISILIGTAGGGFAPVKAVRAAGAAPVPAQAVYSETLSPSPQSRDVGVSDSTGHESLSGRLSFFGDLDGDGRAEIVTQEDIAEYGDGGIRAEIRQVRQPHHRYRFYRLTSDLVVDPVPYHEFRAEGYPFAFDWLSPSPGGFIDLDGDGRRDLVTVSRDFALWQVPKVLVSHSIGAGLDYRVWSQTAAGGFREVQAGVPRGKLKVDLAEDRLGRLSQFAGDFDGDGRVDFVHLGAGRQVGIHRGGSGCRYSAKPDLRITLSSDPQHTGLVKVRDLDGDGRSDLMVVSPLKADDVGVSRPTRLEFYLTGDPP